MTNIYEKEENEILILIASMISSDIQNKQLIEKKINDYAEKNYEKLIKICNKFTENKREDINIRYYSLILLNILINKEKGKKYSEISDKIKEEIRTNCLGLLGNQSKLIRQYSCIVVSSLGLITKLVDQKEWPTLIPLLCNGCDSNEIEFKLSAIRTLNMMWEKIPNGKEVFCGEELCLMESSLIKIMAYPNNTEMALESIKAYKSFMNYISYKFNNADYLKYSLKLIIQFCHKSEINSQEVIKYGIHCITELTKMSYNSIEEFIPGLFQLFSKFCKGDDEILAIQSYIFFTELSTEEIERKKLDDDKNKKNNENNYEKKENLNNKNYIQNNWDFIFNCIQDTVKNYTKDKNNLNDNGEYTRYKSLSPLLYNICQLCNENILDEIYKFSFQMMSDNDPMIINAGIYIFSLTIETIHKHKIIRNISNIIPSLSKYLTINSPELNNTVGDCLEKICKKYGIMIIGDKSLFITTSFLLIKFLMTNHLQNNTKIHLCLCICNLCEHIKCSNLKHLGLFSPYLNDILIALDNLAYLPNSYDYNSNLTYYSFLCISKVLEISNKNDKIILQNYFQKFYKRLNDAQDLSNFNNNKEKQNQFQEYLCICLNEYCKEGNNNANLELEHIMCFYKIIENYFNIRKETFESGLLSLSYLITLFSELKNEKNEEEFLNMIKKLIEYILYTIKDYKGIQNVKNALNCLSKIIHVAGKKIEKYLDKIIKYIETVVLSEEPDKEILGKILLIYTDLFANEGNLIWNHLNMSLECMLKVIEICKKEHEIFLKTELDYDNFKIYIELNDNLIEFIGELLYRIISEKQDLKDFFEKYVFEIIKYINKMFDNNSFKLLDDFILSSASALMDMVEIYRKKVIKLIEDNSIKNLYKFADNTKDSKIISIKNLLQNKIDMINQSSINAL